MPTTANMQTWWNSSPFYDVGVYLGGISLGCNNSNLNASWLTTVEGYGWGVVPLWSGPQAPCACDPNLSPPCTPFPHVFHTNPTLAQQDGTAEANSAATRASALANNISAIYVDIEPYTSSQCGAAVKAYISGWVSQLHTLGFATGAGVYGAPADANTDWNNATNKPDEVWIAKTFTNNLNAPYITTWGLTPLSDMLWATIPGTRIHQYLENKTVTWNGVPLMIDHDIEDGPVGVPNAENKTPSFNFTTFDYPGAAQTSPTGISGISQTGQIGSIVGNYVDASGNAHGFIRDGSGNFTSIDYPGTTYTEVWGINNQLQAVGWYYNASTQTYPGFTYNATTKVYSAPFSYPGAFETMATGINDAGHISGSYEDTSGFWHAFFKYGSTFYSTDYAGATYTYVWGMNGNSQFVGQYTTSAGTGSYQAVILPATGYIGFLPISDPSFVPTLINGINNNDRMIGDIFPTNAGWTGVWYNPVFNQFTNITYPNLRNVNAMNDEGQTVGDYFDSSNACHGFYTTPN